MSINILPDVALLEIFDFYVGGKGQKLDVDEQKVHAWLTLVHVCRKWRDIVFGSPRRLGIRLWYKADLPLAKLLNMWPPLPIDISADILKGYYRIDDIIAALNSEHNDRISRIDLWDIPWSEMENVLAAMHRPFPALACLVLALNIYENMEPPLSVVPDSFLGGSAPHLQILLLHYIPFPGLPKLLLSATRLVELYLTRIPDSVYFPPEVLVDCLSVLTRLETLEVGFDEFDETFLSRVDQNSQYPPPPTRIHLSVLTGLSFRGANEYLEDLVARIDAPLLDDLRIAFFHEPIIDTPQLSQFIGRAPNLKTRDEARVVFFRREVSVALPLPQTNNVPPPLKLGISYKQTELQLSPLARVCGSSFPQDFIPAVKHLDIIWSHWGPEDWEVIENSEWLELFRPFIAVKSLYISKGAVPRIAPALQELVGERVAEVLPALETLTLDVSTSGPIQEGIARFVSARQLSGHPVAISYW